MIEQLKKIPAEKLPPVGLYIRLVNLTGRRNSWTCGQWLEYLTRSKNEN